ncbi:1-phosphofructokinase [Salinicoccus hispanicus]|uniref:Tagatose-6-phosphate kinase n=1 Tax=Salinicoccus hispanicus TaxID=157225 RepID=A0A6N8U4T3_9STAP|nr:1-phosphofructokinase [Salinicoccus hispanicus]MXQ51291.1 1-phosphofructokinase [Salinicoccus hispanicus]
MIYTCTMNPAIDLFCKMKRFVPEAVNRSFYEEYQPNGKGINVSIVLHRLGIQSTALGFLGGFSGGFIKEELDGMGIANDFVDIEGITRINTFIQSEDGEYKVVNGGPEVSKEKQDILIRQISMLGSDDVLFVSGSLPKGVDREILLDIASLSVEKGFKLIWDISETILSDLVAYRPYLIKPNIDEFRNIFPDADINTDADIIRYGKALVQSGVENLIISMGDEGAWFFNASGVLKSNAPEGEVVNTACSGDALLGTFYATLAQGSEPSDALAEAVAAGSSTAFTSGLTDFEDVADLKSTIKITEVEGAL